MVLSMDRWVGKVAVVAGATSGIGAAIAKILVEHGLIVVGLGRRIERIQEYSKQFSSLKGKLYGLKTDITKEEDILEAFKWVTGHLGSVHILINSAGCSKEGLLTEGATEDWRTIFDSNVMGLCIATREAVKVMKTDGINGHIIHINSIYGHDIRNFAKINVYPATKFAVTALTETLRQELNSLGSKIRVTSISPGLVVTGMTLFNENLSEEKRRSFESRPMLNPEDIADAVVYILSTPDHVQVHELIIKPVGEPC